MDCGENDGQMMDRRGQNEKRAATPNAAALI